MCTTCHNKGEGWITYTMSSVNEFLISPIFFSSPLNMNHCMMFYPFSSNAVFLMAFFITVYESRA